MMRELQRELPAMKHVFSIDEWQSFLGGPAHAGDLPEVRPSDPVMIQYTSGTTGFPKGALLLHERLTNNAQQVTLRAGLRRNGVWLAPLPLFHAGGCVVGVLGAVARQTTIVLMSAWTARAALGLIESERVEVINAVPTMLTGMLEDETFATHKLDSLACVLAGASTVPATVVRELQERMGLEVYIIFGQTECGPVATMTNAKDTPEDKQNTVGTPLAGFEVKIVDPETGRTAGIGQIGEFVARGNTMAGYFDNEAATKAAFDAEGWLHTGDLCSMDERGYIRVEGRLREMIIRGGENIYPREIEEVLRAVPGVKDIAIVGLPDHRFGEVVGAFVVPTSRNDFDKTTVVELLRSRLARFKLPERWILLDELPLTPTGKVKKFVLREQWSSGGCQEI